MVTAIWLLLAVAQLEAELQHDTMRHGGFFASPRHRRAKFGAQGTGVRYRNLVWRRN
jgi:hypothetical protein